MSQKKTLMGIRFKPAKDSGKNDLFVLNLR